MLIEFTTFSQNRV